MDRIAQFLLVAEAYGRALEIGETTVSWRVFGDSKKLAAMRSGSDIQVRRLDKGFQWFADNWPDDAAWPTDAERPARSSQAVA